jgi:hypothetical protein
LVLGVLYYISWIPRTDANARRASARAEFLKLGLALELYHRRFQTYPPDTGYGLDMERSPGTYDPGSLWRYLMKPVRDPETGKKVGPFIDEWNPKQLESYNDARAGPSYYLTDPWGGPYGFVAERKRLVHNKSSFDLFSPGPDGVTARDRHGTKPNLAYDGLDNDGNGIADDAAELGPDASRNGDVGDDVNTWSPRGSAVQPHPRRIRRGQVPGDGP